jgi:hypothetical protein
MQLCLGGVSLRRESAGFVGVENDALFAGGRIELNQIRVHLILCGTHVDFAVE